MSTPGNTTAKVVFACVHNAGRSQMAAAFFNQLAVPSRARAISAGTEPASSVHPEVLAVMKEEGLDLSTATPQKLTIEVAQGSELLVTLGCNEQCPAVPGARREDWAVEDPKGKSADEVREIRDEVKRRVRELIVAEGWDQAPVQNDKQTTRMKKARNSCCSYCGHPFEGQPWPRVCSSCGETSYVNPIPVAVVLLPVDDGLLLIRRSIEPALGKLALPGGYVNLGESWQQAGAREVKEESGVELDPLELEDFGARSTPDGKLVLIFGLAKHRISRDLLPFDPTNETSERVVLTSPVDLAFELHTQAMREYFDRWPIARY